MLPNHPNLAMRRAVEGDLDRIYEIWRARPGAGSNDRASDGRFHRDGFKEGVLLSSPFGFWVAQVGGRVVGWSSLTPTRFNPALRETMAEAGAYVDPAHRGSGLGFEILQFACHSAHGSPLEWILGYVAASNAAILAVSRRIGFELVGDIPAHVKGPRPQVLLLRYRVP